MPTLKLRQDNVCTVPYQGRGGKHQCVYLDEALESFGLRVYPSGRRVYVCAYRVNTRKRLAKKTWREDRSYLNRHVLSKLSGRLTVSLVTADIEAIHSQLGVEHPYGANDVLKMVRKMFNWARSRVLCPGITRTSSQASSDSRSGRASGS